jgi:hypothetical protein
MIQSFINESFESMFQYLRFTLSRIHSLFIAGLTKFVMKNEIHHLVKNTRWPSVKTSVKLCEIAFLHGDTEDTQ